VSADIVRVGTSLAALEMIRSGTTTFTDMYYFEEVVAEATRAAGLRAVLGQTIIRFPVADAKTPEEALARAEAFIQRFMDDDLIVPAVAPHSMYTLEAGTLEAARAMAATHGVPFLIHLAETKTEYDDAVRAHGQTPTKYLGARGLLAPNVIAAHGVWLDPADVTALANAGAGVSHNPESNMKLASGTAPVPALLAAGVNVGLGTDGAASNNDLDMFEAMRQAALLHKLVSRDPRVVSAPQALAMATIGGARALGLDRTLGSIEVGKLADIIAVRTDRARQTPMYDPVSHLVYATHGDDVVMTIVNGRILMRDGVVRTLDEAEVIRAARAAADQVRKAVQ
jgi:5-methylthioadenosine/S-adenosylhomocysteine deaminase